MEVWKSINGYEGFYEISNLGNLRSLDRFVQGNRKAGYFIKGKILKVSPGKIGYPVAHLHKNGKPKREYVHRLVAEHFIPKIEGKEIVNHIDGNKSNNHYLNLEWVTHSENHMHALRIGLFVPGSSNKNGKVQGEKNYRAKLKESDVIFILKNSKKYGGNMNTVALSEKFNVTRMAISAIVNRRTWKYIDQTEEFKWQLSIN